jgi:hypothetical protein
MNRPLKAQLHNSTKYTTSFLSTSQRRDMLASCPWDTSYLAVSQSALLRAPDA